LAVKCTLALIVLAAATATGAAAQECAKVTRAGSDVTMVAESSSVVSAVANTLAQQFDVLVSAEEPHYEFSGDFEDVSKANPAWSAGHPGKHYLVPRHHRIQLHFSVRPGGYPQDVVALLKQVVQKANEEMPFGYRLDIDGPFYTLVPTTTRNSAGRIVPAMPLLDRKVTIPPGTRSIAESADMMAKSLSAQTGLSVSCCQMIVAGKPWGMLVVPFEAHDEPARKVLERLTTLLAGTPEPQDYWLQGCSDGFCAISVYALWGNSCLRADHWDFRSGADTTKNTQREKSSR
jgi:hypothetical protein